VGADDYVVKPFSPQELVSRVKAVLRRCSPIEGNETVLVSMICALIHKTPGFCERSRGNFDRQEFDALAACETPTPGISTPAASRKCGDIRIY
jgi:DNA-binding response OmpR family regulator